MASHTQRVPCERCGVMRQAHTKRGPLCRDCIAALTPKERKEWLSRK